MFNEKIMKQIRESEKKRKGQEGWNALATILALGVIGPLIVLLFNRYSLAVLLIIALIVFI